VRGSVSTRTTGEVWSEKVSFGCGGSEMMSGSEGTVNRAEAGAGAKNVAEALT